MIASCDHVLFLVLKGDADDLQQAMQTTRYFHAIWKQVGFTPEIYDLLNGKPIQGRTGYPLRPELAESIYYLSR